MITIQSQEEIKVKIVDKEGNTLIEDAVTNLFLLYCQVRGINSPTTRDLYTRLTREINREYKTSLSMDTVYFLFQEVLTEVAKLKKNTIVSGNLSDLESTLQDIRSNN